MSNLPAGYAQITKLQEMLDPADGRRKVAIEFEAGGSIQVAIVDAPRAAALGLEVAHRRRKLVPLPIE